MAAKFAIVIAAAVAAMILLLLAPGFSNNKDPSTDELQMQVEYSRQNLTKTQDGLLVAANSELLVISNDGSATYAKTSGSQTDRQTFSVGSADLKSLRALIGVGFMQIPQRDYLQKQGVENFTKYTLKVQADGDDNTVSWVDPDYHEGTIPPLIMRIGSQLDDIISRHA